MLLAPERIAEDRAKVLAAREAPRTRDRFALTSATVRALVEKAADGKDAMILEAPASSTCIDLMGDKISLGCLQSMQLQAASMTTWLNHSYALPEDVCGTIERAWIEEATDPKQGAVHDLWIRMVVDPDAERAVKAWQHIKNGRTFGFSIGGFITDWDFVDLPDGDYCFVIEGLELFEISLVGIPANQRAVIDGVGKAATFSLEDRTAAPLAGAIRKKFAADPATRIAQRKALATRVVRGAEDPDEPGLANVPEPPAQPPAAPPAHVAEPTTPAPPPAPRPAGLPAFSGIRFGVGALTLTIATEGERSILTFHGASSAYPVAVVTVEGEVVKAGKALSAATRQKLEAVQGHVADAAAHGACPDVTKSIGNAADGLTEILGQDDQSGDDDADAKALRAAIAARQAQLATLETDFTALAAERDAMVAENKWLREILMRAETTSVGRVTQPTAGESVALRATTDPAARRRSTNDVLSDLTHALAGHNAGDARTRSI